MRRQLVGMVPAVASLHPDAGRELKSADDEAAPALAAQVARLAVLDQVRRELPGSEAATAAADAAEQVRARLAEGVRVTAKADDDHSRQALQRVQTLLDRWRRRQILVFSNVLRAASNGDGGSA